VVVVVSDGDALSEMDNADVARLGEEVGDILSWSKSRD
jgi:hypothetical protein